ncbi:unnamed protein product [Penicillium olsonii]|nr:unnamed protein product [Penicillium olsonii]CAG8183303.1 unnamed protein product [Penicillium olsonii]
MGALFFYLVHHPESLARVTMDVRGVFKDEGEITSGPKLASCIYLRACIRETMRLVPAVPNLSPRIVLAETAEIDGRVVPKNTNVGVSLSSYNQSPASFDRANEFRPERWISADGKQLNLKLFRSFGEGPRRCVGMHLALLELELVIARAVFRYDVLVPPEGLSNQKTQRAERAHHEFAFDAWAVASGRAGQISSDCFVKKDQRR